jgi:hypothetical protein
MSLRAMTWALEQAPVTDPTQALVLVALADSAQEDGRNAWPSQATLARRARVSDRSVRRILAQLEADGVIRRGDQRVVEHLKADRRPVVWDLNLTADTPDRPDTGDRSSTTGGTPTTGRPCPSDRTPVTERPDTGVRQTVLEQSMNGGGVRASAPAPAREAPPATDAPPRCPRHTSLPLGAEPPCRFCMQLRERWEAERDDEPTGPRRGDLPWCRHPDCDEQTRLRETRDGIKRCPECHTLAGARPAPRTVVHQPPPEQPPMPPDSLINRLAGLAAADRKAHR